MPTRYPRRGGEVSLDSGEVWVRSINWVVISIKVVLKAIRLSEVTKELSPDEE